jgi:hypothetical protein
MRPLRVIVYDRTCTGPAWLPGLSHAWRAGGVLYDLLGRTDAIFGAASWGEALDWLADHQPQQRVAEVQYWGHGNWGCARLGGELLDARALQPGHPHHQRLRALAARLLPGDEGLFWFRTCETFGTASGQAFAQAWTRFLGCRTAGHTYVIGLWQSGLHSLGLGETPTWSPAEGLPPKEAPASAAAPSGAPAQALRSRPGAPNTITCFHGAVPAGF